MTTSERLTRPKYCSRSRSFPRFRARLEALDTQVSGLRDDLQALKSRIFSAETRISTNVERGEEARSLIERHRLEIAAAGEKMRVQQDEIEHTDELLARMIDTLRSHEASLEEQNEKVRVAREERTGDRTQYSGARRDGCEAGRSPRILAQRTFRGRGAGGRLPRRGCGCCKASRRPLLRPPASLQRASQETERRAQLAQLAAENAQTEQTEAQLAYEAAQERRQAAEAALNAYPRKPPALNRGWRFFGNSRNKGRATTKALRLFCAASIIRSSLSPRSMARSPTIFRFDPRFIPAIEAALGAGLQAIVFKDTGIAELALQNLSGRRLGKATICPRDWISETPTFGYSISRSRGEPGDQSSSAPMEDTQVGLRLSGRSDCLGGRLRSSRDGEAGALASRLLTESSSLKILKAPFA